MPTKREQEQQGSTLNDTSPLSSNTRVASSQGAVHLPSVLPAHAGHDPVFELSTVGCGVGAAG
jgi:hypothetical protein